MLKKLAIALTMSGLTYAAAADDTTKLTIDPSETRAPISRHIFDHFAEHLGNGIYGGVWVGPESDIPNTRGIRNDVVEALKEIKAPNIRWPGGCYADEYHWRNGIGPRDERRATVNANWGNVLEPNTFGTHEFMDLIEQVGAEAYISANVGSGTVKEASDWLEYMTATLPTALAEERIANGREEPFEVPYWGIGNESWGCGGSMSAEYYLSLLKRYARFNRNLDPDQSMQTIAVGPEEHKPEYTETIMSAWADKIWSWDIQGISLHQYTVAGGWPPSKPSVGFGEDAYAQVLAEALTIEETLEIHEEIMDKYDPEKKIALIVDEWGAWYAKLPDTKEGFLIQQNSQRDALLAALSLNIFARHSDRVRMANIAQMVNVLQALIMTDEEKMVLTPTYHVFDLYVPFHDATRVEVDYKAGAYKHGKNKLPRLDAIAAQDKEGVTWLAVSNVDPDEQATIAVDVEGMKAKTVEGRTLSAPGVAAVNTFDEPDTVTPTDVTGRIKDGKAVLTLQPASVTVVSIQ
jgi:alpha-N-arabinofuranosidase